MYRALLLNPPPLLIFLGASCADFRAARRIRERVAWKLLKGFSLKLQKARELHPPRLEGWKSPLPVTQVDVEWVVTRLLDLLSIPRSQDMLCAAAVTLPTREEHRVIRM